MDAPIPPPGANRANPMTEDEDLAEEPLVYSSDERTSSLRRIPQLNSPSTVGRARVISSFTFFAGGKPVSVSPGNFQSQSFSGLEVVGIVGTIHGQEGCFGQCGWFGGDNLDWFWAHLPEVSKLEIRRDVRFRGG